MASELKLAVYTVESFIGMSGWLSRFPSDLGSGHDLMDHGFETHMGLCADSSESGACFGFCVCVSLSAPPSLINELPFKKKLF